MNSSDNGWRSHAGQERFNACRRRGNRHYVLESFECPMCRAVTLRVATCNFQKRNFNVYCAIFAGYSIGYGCWWRRSSYKGQLTAECVELLRGRTSSLAIGCVRLKCLTWTWKLMQRYLLYLLAGLSCILCLLCLPGNRCQNGHGAGHALECNTHHMSHESVFFFCLCQCDWMWTHVWSGQTGYIIFIDWTITWNQGTAGYMPNESVEMQFNV